MNSVVWPQTWLPYLMASITKLSLRGSPQTALLTYLDQPWWLVPWTVLKQIGFWVTLLEEMPMRGVKRTVSPQEAFGQKCWYTTVMSQGSLRPHAQLRLSLWPRMASDSNLPYNGSAATSRCLGYMPLLTAFENPGTVPPKISGSSNKKDLSGPLRSVSFLGGGGSNVSYPSFSSH